MQTSTIPTTDFDWMNMMMCKKLIEIKKNSRKKKDWITTDYLLQAVSKFFDIPEKEIKSKRRYPRLALSRGYYCVLCRELIFSIVKRKKVKLSFQKIGSTLNKRDHSTVMHSINTFRDYTEQTPRFRMFYVTLKREILNGVVKFNEPASQSIKDLDQKIRTEYSRIYSKLKRERIQISDEIEKSTTRTSDPNFSYRSRHT